MASKHAVVIDTKLNNQKIKADFKELEKSTQSLVNQYNRQVDSIKSQELAIQKVKDQIETLQMYKDTNLIKENEAQRLNELIDKLPILESKLQQTKDEATQTGQRLQVALDKKHTLEFGDGIDKIGNKIDKFKNRMTRMLETVMIFSLIRKGLTSLRNSFMSLLTQNDAFNNSLNQIKANLMTAFAPIYNACLPAINSLMNALSKLTGTIAVFISGLFGKSLKQSQKEAKALSKSLNKVASSGENASGSLASFDKLEVINDSSSSGDGGSGSSANYDGEIQYSQKLLDILNRIKDFIVNNKELVIGAIAGITGALIALKVLGLDPITSLGIGLVIAGVVMAISSLIAYLNDPSWENFGNIIIGIGIAIIGLGAIILGLPAVIVGAIVLIVGIIIKYWEQIKSFLQNGINWLTGKSDWVHKMFGDTIGNIYDFFVRTLQRGLDWFDLTFKSIKGLFDGIIKFIKGVFSGDWKMAWEGVKQIFANIWNWISGTAKLILSGLIDKAKTIVSTMGNVIYGVFKGIVNGILTQVENIINGPIKAINGLIDTINVIPGVNFGKLSTLKLPRLAGGTVIPPRHEFAAILGDQKHGTNIEAPLDTIKQANREVLEEFMNKFGSLGSGEREIVLKNLSFIFQMGNIDFRKFIVDQIRLREKDLGKPLFVS